MTPTKGQPSTRKGERYPPEILTEDEVRRLLAQCSLKAPTGIRNRALITLMYRGGLRISEALKLRVADVDVNAGTVRILHGKGDKSRVVGMDEGAMAIVQRWIDVRRAPPLSIRANGHPLICTLAGGKLDDDYVRVMLKRIAAKAGIEKTVRPHGLRHSHYAELAAEGVPMNVIQQEAGHAHLATTDVYLRHIAPADVIAMGRGRRRFSETGGGTQPDVEAMRKVLADPEVAAMLARLAAERREDN